MTLADVLVELGPTGQGRVLIDGEPVLASALVIEAEVGEVPLVTITRPTRSLRFASVAEVTHADPADQVAAYLEGIDPEDLERVTLARLDLDSGPGALTAAMLRQLVEWARSDDRDEVSDGGT